MILFQTHPIDFTLTSTMYELLFGRHNQRSRKLQITPTSTTVSSPSPSLPPFKLPDDWVVELRPRKDGRFDKYYYEPGTGKKFRSLAAIQNYLNGDVYPSRKKLKPCNQENMAILPCNFTRNPSFRLPKDWVVEEKPRKNINYARTVDRTYIELGTGKRFRSLLSVERYIAEKNGCAATTRPHQLYLTDVRKHTTMVKASNLGYYSRNSSFRLPNGWLVEEKQRSNINYTGTVDRTYIEPGTGKRFRSLTSVEKYIAEKNLRAAAPRPHQLYLTDGEQHTTMAEESSPGNDSLSNSFGFDKAPTLRPRKPPAKVEWVLSPVESIWKPFINDALVSESLKCEWSQAFVHTLYYT